MSLNEFTPEVWSGAVLLSYEKALVFAALADREYEGEITGFGDRVHINSISDPTISNYVKDNDINSPEALNAADQVLVIDQAKYFNFQVDSIDQVQNKPKALVAGTRRAGYKLADTVDQFMAALYTQASASNAIGSEGSPVTPTANTAGTAMYEYLVTAGKNLNISNAPTEGRWAVLTPAAYALLQLDNRFVANGTPANMDVVTNGLVGRAAGFDIYMSNNVAKPTANYRMLFGVREAWNFASQITEMRAYQPEKRFADALKGLMVYGGKVTRPDGLGVITSTL
jgi:hypothetical protein